jgi:quercetin 2,3-dioxygenase
MVAGEAFVSPKTYLLAGEDAFGAVWGLGMSRIAFKVLPKEPGDPLVIENIFHQRGGPGRHVHDQQDEWFYALEGEFLVEVGTTQYVLRAGDALLAPRNIPHVWGYVGHGQQGRILIAFLPAGRMVEFFREVTQWNAMPPQDPELWRAYGMELLGPPLALADAEP